MPNIHAVIYSRKGRAWIAVAEWIAEGAGIVKLSGLDDETRVPLADFVGTNLDESIHKIIPDPGGLVFEPQVPRLLLFRVGTDDWVARGFQPWGAVAPDDNDPDAVGLWLIASDADDEQDEGYRWARAAARLLFHMREDGAGGASQKALNLVRDGAVSLNGSIAFPSSEDVDQAFDPGAAADFGNAADSGN